MVQLFMIDFNTVYNVTKDLTILYVEDDENFREDTSDVLLTLFKRVDLAVDGKKGIDKYLSYLKQEDKYYDIVITDVKMPIINGLELTKLIYKENITQPIIVISAHNDWENLLEFVNIGIKQFLVKPIDSNKILEILYEIGNNILTLQQNKINLDIFKLNNNYHWDCINSLLYCGKDIVKLTNKELLLMKLFMKNKYITSAYEEIFIALWQDEQYRASVQQLKPLISNLRKKIPFQRIESLSKVGYRLIL